MGGGDHAEKSDPLYQKRYIGDNCIDAIGSVAKSLNKISHCRQGIFDETNRLKKVVRDYPEIRPALDRYVRETRDAPGGEAFVRMLAEEIRSASGGTALHIQPAYPKTKKKKMRSERQRLKFLVIREIGIKEIQKKKEELGEGYAAFLDQKIEEKMTEIEKSKAKDVVTAPEVAKGEETAIKAESLPPVDQANIGG